MESIHTSHIHDARDRANDKEDDASDEVLKNQKSQIII